MLHCLACRAHAIRGLRRSLSQLSPLPLEAPVSRSVRAVLREPPSSPAPSDKWFGLREGLRRAIAGLGLSAPSGVQRAAIPPALAGADVLISAATGEGKTLAYLLPLAHRVKMDEACGGVVTRTGRPRALILVPTRELALQVTRVAKALCHSDKFSAAALVGGRSERAQREALSRAPIDVLVATTGRLAAAVEKGWLALGDVRYVVVDEADTMLALDEGDGGGVAPGGGRGDPSRRVSGGPLRDRPHRGFADEVNAVLRPIFEVAKRQAAVAALAQAFAQGTLSPLSPNPDERRVQFFIVGATLSSETLRLVKRLLPGIHSAIAPTAHRPPAALIQTFVRVGGEPHAKHAALLEAMGELCGPGLRGGAPEPPPSRASKGGAGGVLVFCNTIDSARSTAHFLGENGYAVAMLHGAILPRLRDSEFALFTSGSCPILVATDAAARGLDFGGGASAVILFDFPLSPVEYLHRAGRAARAGRTGRVLSLVAKRDAVLALAIERASVAGEDVTALSSARVDYVPPAQRGAFKDAMRARSVGRGADEGGRAAAAGAAPLPRAYDTAYPLEGEEEEREGAQNPAPRKSSGAPKRVWAGDVSARVRERPSLRERKSIRTRIRSSGGGSERARDSGGSGGRGSGSGSGSSWGGGERRSGNELRNSGSVRGNSGPRSSSGRASSRGSGSALRVDGGAPQRSSARGGRARSASASKAGVQRSPIRRPAPKREQARGERTPPRRR